MASICASIMEKTPEDFVKAAKGVDTDLIEVRADSLTDCTPEAVHRTLSELKKHTASKIILTVRSKEEGGLYNGTENERKQTILTNLHLADMVDIELNSQIREEVVEVAKTNKIETIISYHDFNNTPEKKIIQEIIDMETVAGADYSKVAFMANTIEDVLDLLFVTLESSKNNNVITISMGEIGTISRIAAPAFGSSITYAAASGKTAPGQLSVKETKTIFKIIGLV